MSYTILKLRKSVASFEEKTFGQLHTLYFENYVQNQYR